jgi:2-polyprenyl-3-methyl-5-hydroxy-6-metoxy-1,4-benzoquinol methylase
MGERTTVEVVVNKGETREASLDRQSYFSDSYFTLPQLFSLSHQIEKINKLAPRDILEIGIGNGFTSSFLRRAGYDVMTADINPALEPDICAPLSELEEHLNGRRFDLVVCCEVLEHMPFNEFCTNIRILSKLGDRLFMTLPNCKKYFGFGGLVRIPKLGYKVLGVYISSRILKSVPEEHFWELGSSRDTSLDEIIRNLRDIYSKVYTGRFAMNPYHQYFIAEN